MLDPAFEITQLTEEAIALSSLKEGNENNLFGNSEFKDTLTSAAKGTDELTEGGGIFNPDDDSQTQTSVSSAENVDTHPVAPEPTILRTADILDNSTSLQFWQEGITLSAFSHDGNPIEVIYDTEFIDEGFGVAGARWQQIEFSHKGENQSGYLEIGFGELASDVVLTIGIVGLSEGSSGYGQLGKWTALDADDNWISEGVLGPGLSLLGPGVKVADSYGLYPIAISSTEPIAKLVIQATGFGYGEGSLYEDSCGENDSDFNIVELSYLRYTDFSTNDMADLDNTDLPDADCTGPADAANNNSELNLCDLIDTLDVIPDKAANDVVDNSSVDNSSGDVEGAHDQVVNNINPDSISILDKLAKANSLPGSQAPAKEVFSTYEEIVGSDGLTGGTRFSDHGISSGKGYPNTDDLHPGGILWDENSETSEGILTTQKASLHISQYAPELAEAIAAIEEGELITIKNFIDIDISRILNFDSEFSLLQEGGYLEDIGSETESYDNGFLFVLDGVASFTLERVSGDIQNLFLENRLLIADSTNVNEMENTFIEQNLSLNEDFWSEILTHQDEEKSFFLLADPIKFKVNFELIYTLIKLEIKNRSVIDNSQDGKGIANPPHEFKV